MRPKIQYFIIAVTAISLLSMTGCGIRYYQTYPAPLSMPEKKTAIAVAGGFPSQFEYQKRLGKRFDLVTGVGYSRMDVEDNIDTHSVSMLPFYLGTRYWFTNPRKNGFDFNLFGGGNGAFNFEQGPWQQFGGDFGVALGLHVDHFTFSVPFRFGIGKAINLTGDIDSDVYEYYCIEWQFLFKGDKLGAGFRFGVNFGFGSDASNLLIHVPMTGNAFLTYSL
jgi:hypothetical protein